MISTAAGIDSLMLNLTQEIQVHATLETTFAALLEQLGPANDTPDGRPMPMKIEPWPGGRWFRDLGDGNGHFWGLVQAIKRPTLIEITGPLFMSYPVVSNVQYRLTEENGVTLIKFHHMALGLIPDNDKQGWRKAGPISLVVSKHGLRRADRTRLERERVRRSPCVQHASRAQH